MIAYYTEDSQYLDNDFCRTEKEAKEQAEWHLSDQYKRFGLKLVAKIFNELRYKPDDPGIEIRIV